MTWSPLRALSIVVALGLGILVLASLPACQREAPADVKVEKVEPEEATAGATITVSGDGFSDESSGNMVRIGEAEAQVKSSGPNMLVVQVPEGLQPGTHELTVTNHKTERTSQPVRLRVVEPAPEVKIVTIPAGRRLIVRTVDSISSEKNRPGDTFLLTLDEPLVVNGLLVAPKGSEVIGRVVHVKEPGRVKGRAEIGFTLVQLRPPKSDRKFELVTNNFYSRAQATKKRDALIIGGGAGIGTAIGAIAGGGKGAAIGAGAGAAAGTGTVLLTRGKQVVIPSETRFRFQLRRPVEVQMAQGPSR